MTTQPTKSYKGNSPRQQRDLQDLRGAAHVSIRASAAAQDRGSRSPLGGAEQQGKVRGGKAWPPSTRGMGQGCHELSPTVRAALVQGQQESRSCWLSRQLVLTTAVHIQMVTLLDFPSPLWPRGEQACTPVLRKDQLGSSTSSLRQGNLFLLLPKGEGVRQVLRVHSFILLSYRAGSFTRPLRRSCGFQHHLSPLGLECLIPRRRETHQRPPSLIRSISWDFHLHLLLMFYSSISSESRTGRERCVYTPLRNLTSLCLKKGGHPMFSFGTGKANAPSSPGGILSSRTLETPQNPSEHSVHGTNHHQ